MNTYINLVNIENSFYRRKKLLKNKEAKNPRIYSEEEYIEQVLKIIQLAKTLIHESEFEIIVSDEYGETSLDMPLLIKEIDNAIIVESKEENSFDVQQVLKEIQGLMKRGILKDRCIVCLPCGYSIKAARILFEE